MDTACLQLCHLQRVRLRSEVHTPGPGCKEEAELNNVLKTCIMVRRLKRDVLAQLPPKRRTQARPDLALPLMHFTPKAGAATHLTALLGKMHLGV